MNALNWIFLLPIAALASSPFVYLNGRIVANLWREPSYVSAAFYSALVSFVAGIVFVWASALVAPSNKKAVAAVIASAVTVCGIVVTYFAFRNGQITKCISVIGFTLGAVTSYRGYCIRDKRRETLRATPSPAKQ